MRIRVQLNVFSQSEHTAVTIVPSRPPSHHLSALSPAAKVTTVHHRRILPIGSILYLCESIMLSCVVVISSFLLLHTIPLCEYATIYVDGHFVCSCLWLLK